MDDKEAYEATRISKGISNEKGLEVLEKAIFRRFEYNDDEEDEE